VVEYSRRFDGYSIEEYSADIDFLVAAIAEEATNLRATWRQDAKRLDEFERRARQLLNDSVELLMLRYSRGDDWPSLSSAVRDAVALCPFVLEIHDARTGRAGVFDITSYLQDAARLLAFALATGLPESDVRAFVHAVRGRGVCGLWDRWVAQSSLGPGEPVAPNAWKDSPYEPLVKALDAKAELRPALVAQYLKDWRRRIRPYPWSGDDKRTGSAGIGLWSFEVACSVMIFRIDDSSFRHHKDYPLDVVDQFRQSGTKLSRGGVLASTAEHVSAPVEKRVLPDVAPPVQTWLTLVTDGDAETIDALSDQWPARAESYEDWITAIDELAERGWAIRADWKDSAGASFAAGKLAEKWRLPEYLSRLETATVEDEFVEFGQWLRSHGIALVQLDTDADEYVAVAIRRAHCARALEAAGRLGLRASVVGD
jgi:hypothetical protein